MRDKPCKKKKHETKLDALTAALAQTRQDGIAREIKRCGNSSCRKYHVQVSGVDRILRRTRERRDRRKS